MSGLKDSPAELLSVYSELCGLPMVLCEPGGETVLGPFYPDGADLTAYDAAAAALATGCGCGKHSLRAAFDGQLEEPFVFAAGADRGAARYAIAPVCSPYHPPLAVAAGPLPPLFEAADETRLLERMSKLAGLLLRLSACDVLAGTRSPNLAGNEAEATAAESPFPVTADELLERYAAPDDLFVCTGFAQLTAPGVYEIVRAYGSGSPELTGRTVREGEGAIGGAAFSDGLTCYTGAIAATRGGHWALSSETPFTAEVTEIWCRPVRAGGETLGVLFALTTSERGARWRRPSWEAVFAHSLQPALCSALLQNRLRKQNRRLQAISGVVRFLSETDDPTRVLFTLVDASLSLMRSPTFAYVAVTGDDPAKCQIVCRGMAAEQAGKRAKEQLTLSFRRPETEHGEGHNAAVRHTTDGIPLIECAFSIGTAFRGALCVAASDEREAAECLDFVSAVAFIGSRILQAAREQKRHGEGHRQTVQLLGETVRRRDQSWYVRSKKASELILAYAATEGLEPKIADVIAEASLLSGLDLPDLGAGGGTLAPALSLLTEYRRMQKGITQGGFSQQAQLLDAALRLSGPDSEASGTAGGSVSEYERRLRRYVQRNEGGLAEVSLAPEPQRLDSSASDLRGVEEVAKQYGLSKREKEVLLLVTRAKSNKEIASLLYISEHTVKNHMTNIFGKMDVSDRTQAIMKVYTAAGN